jgi:hypothetical protein
MVFIVITCYGLLLNISQKRGKKIRNVITYITHFVRVMLRVPHVLKAFVLTTPATVYLGFLLD